MHARVASRVAELLTLTHAIDLRSRRRGRPAKHPLLRAVSLAATAVLQRLKVAPGELLRDDNAAAALEEHAASVCAEIPSCLRCPLVSFCETGKQRLRSLEDDRPTVIDIFAGAGGLGLGFEAAGFRVALAIELDRDAAQTYRLNHPGVPVLELDVAEVTAEEILERVGGRRPDVVCAGPPCQSYSAAGPRLAVDPRHRLYRHVIALAHDLRPRVVVIENVPGMEERRVGGRTYREIVEEELREQFLVESYELNATDFGVPQERQRLIFFCLAEGEAKIGKPAARFHPDGEGGLPRTPTVMETLARFPRRQHGSRTDVATVRGVITRNLATMRHSTRVIKKIRNIVPGKGPLSYRRVPKRFAQTIIAGHRALPVHPTGHRTMSVREAAALQGFPDGFTFAGPRANQPLQVANAVPPPLAEAIAAHIAEYLEHHGSR